MDSMYCRFCAELKSDALLINLDCDDKRCNEIVLKLTFLNAVYVDVSQRNNMPNTVCFNCYECLDTAYEFLNKVRKAQDILGSLFTTETAPKLDFSDDDRSAFDDFFVTTQDISELKYENECVKPDEDPSLNVQVKVEPEDEELLTKNSEDVKNVCGPVNNQELIVQEFLDAVGNTELKTAPIIFDVNKETKSWKEYPWICSFCKIEFFDINTLRTHSKIMHKKCAAFTCVDCKEYVKIEGFKAFVKHVRQHRLLLWNACHYCDENINRETLSVHFKRHLENSSKVCRACGEIFQSAELLKQHRNDYIISKPTRKPRRKAGQPITVEDLTCEICKKVYKNPNSLRDHIKRHKTDRKKNYTCDRCGKTFYSKGTLTSHIQTHDEIRPHACKICNKSFQFPNMLRRHVQVHTGVKPFSCELCGRKFRLQYQLNSHKIIHTDSMPYSCKHCHKSFRFKQILKSHERQHTGAKPYSCQHCFMDFSNWSNYNKHMRRRHNVETAKKKITPEGVFPVNPETGQVMHVEVQGIEEWRRTVLIPGKRGRKKVKSGKDS